MLILLLYRALHVRLMLYRPTFCKFCIDGALKGSQAEPEVRMGHNGRQDVARVFESHCALACFYTASELIEMLHKAISEDLFGAWWFALFCEIVNPLVAEGKQKADILMNQIWFQAISS